MKPSRRALPVQNQLQRVPGKNLQAALWKLKTAAYKRWILLQQRFSLYSYARWIEESEPDYRHSIHKDPGVLISLLIPVTRASLPRLSSTLGSLQAQTYTNWEVCLSYEKACFPEVEALMRETSVDRNHVQHLALEPEHGEDQDPPWIAFEQVYGGWIGVLHSGDYLSPGALAACVECILLHPQVEIVYTDEDCLALDGRNRSSPFFKPDYSPELLLSVNYLRSAFFRRDLIAKCNLVKLNIDEIVYHCIEIPRSVLHIPEVHFHFCRASSALGGTRFTETKATPENSPSAENIVVHLSSLGLPDATYHFHESGKGQAIWSFEEKLVSIIIPTRDNVNLLKNCIRSILSQTRYRRFEIILVENNSQKAETLTYYEELRRLPEVHLIEFNGAFNYSAANNLGVRKARGDWLVFLNNDIEIIDPGWLEELCRWVSRPDIGAVGAKLIYPDGRIQHAGIVIGMEGHASHVFGGVKDGYTGPYGSVDWYRDYSAVTGACLAIRREVFETVHGFDEGYKLVFSDVDLCQRIIRHGYRVVYTPFARLIHHEGRTRYRRIPVQDIQRGAEQFEQVVKEGDPYYNPNLSYAVRIPALRRPNEEKPSHRLKSILRYY